MSHGPTKRLIRQQQDSNFPDQSQTIQKPPVAREQHHRHLFHDTLRLHGSGALSTFSGTFPAAICNPTPRQTRPGRPAARSSGAKQYLPPPATLTASPIPPPRQTHTVGTATKKVEDLGTRGIRSTRMQGRGEGQRSSGPKRGYRAQQYRAHALADAIALLRPKPG